MTLSPILPRIPDSSARPAPSSDPESAAESFAELLSGADQATDFLGGRQGRPHVPGTASIFNEDGLFGSASSTPESSRSTADTLGGLTQSPASAVPSVAAHEAPHDGTGASAVPYAARTGQVKLPASAGAGMRSSMPTLHVTMSQVDGAFRKVPTGTLAPPAVKAGPRVAAGPVRQAGPPPPKPIPQGASPLQVALETGPAGTSVVALVAGLDGEEQLLLEQRILEQLSRHGVRIRFARVGAAPSTSFSS